MLTGIWRNRLRRHSPRNAVAPHGDGVISAEEEERDRERERERTCGRDSRKDVLFKSALFPVFGCVLAPITYGNISGQQNIHFFFIFCQ